MTRLVMATAVALMLGSPAAARAEMRRVEISVLGMDCAICAHSVRIAAEKTEGVESVKISLERASADIRLRPGNHVGIAQLRQLIKANGFTAKDATVTVVGNLIERNGKPALDVSGTNTTWLLKAAAKDAGPYNDAAKRLASARAALVEVTGVVSPPADPSQPEQITVVSLATAVK